MGWTTKGSEFESQCGQKCSLLHFVQTASEAHPASYPVGTGFFFPGAKAAGLEADHVTPINAKVKKMQVYTSTPPYIFMA
jgi:hypothetical protein